MGGQFDPLPPPAPIKASWVKYRNLKKKSPGSAHYYSL